MKINFKCLSTSLIKNSIWVILASLISKGLNFISIAWIAKLLGPEIFGEYNVVQTTVGMFGTVSGLGLGLAATKLIAEWRIKDTKRVGNIIGTLYYLSFLVSIVVAVIFFITSGWVSTSLLNNKSLSMLLKITSLIVVFDAINGVQNGFLAGFEAFKEIAFISTIVIVISTPLLIIGSYYYGLTGLTVMLLVTRLINVIVNTIYLNKKLYELNIVVKPQLQRDNLRSIFAISIPSFLSSFATSPVTWVTTTIFVNQPNGYNALGSYNAASQLKTLVLFLPESAGKVTIPRLANAYGNGDLKTFKSTVISTFLLNLVLSVLPSIALLFFSGIFQHFFGAKFDLSNNLIQIVLATGVLIAITNAIGYIFICSNLIWYDFYLRIIWGITLILFIVFYGRYNGALGYGVSILSAYVINLITQVIIIFLKFRHKKI